MSNESIQTQGNSPVTTLITGATDGIGLGLSRLLSGGERLVLVGRRDQPEGDGLFSENAYCQADLVERDAHERIVAFLEGAGITHLSRLILNAGTGYWGPTREQTRESILATVSVNLRSSVALIHACHPLLRRAGGRVVLIGSVVAALPCADYAVYGASKAALDGLARSLRYELAPHVRVQMIHPGATRSGLHEKIGVDRDRVDWERFPPADTVARKVLGAMDRGGKRKLLSIPDRLIWSVGQAFPWIVDRALKGA